MNGIELRGPEGLWEDYWSSMSTLFDNIVNATACVCNPTVDITEDKDHYLLSVELPGLNESDFKVEHENGILSISGKWPEPKEDITVIRRERPSGEFLRRFSIPEDVDVERIDAKYKNGVLELTLPKKESAKPKAVKVEIH